MMTGAQVARGDSLDIPDDDSPERHSTHNVIPGQVTNAVQAGYVAAVNIYGPNSGTDTSVPVTRPVAGCSPFDLEVHRSIQVGDDVSLPTYIPRTHDEILRQLVELAATGRSGLAVLVGGSSTGKTRACWEAIQRLPAEWRLWHPINPGRPEAAARELSGIGPRTVVWLNESHHYLLTPGSPLGEQVAAGLRDLMRDPARAPVLVLGTLWPEYWSVLSQQPPDGIVDQHAQARALLAGHSVRVADAFTAVEASTALSTGDPRLREALDQGHDRQVAQYLAGAPALVERYEHAPPAARALLDVAIDARRLGHGLQLSRSLLEEAAPDYLTDAQWSRLGDGWFTHALAYCLEVGRGGSSPLAPIRPRPGRVGVGEERFRLEDYLEQNGRRIRGTAIAPPSLWDAMLTHAPAEDLAGIGIQAEVRGLSRIAVETHLRVATAESLPRVARLLDQAGHRDQAVFAYRRAAEAGDMSSLRRWTRLVERGQAITLCREFAEKTGNGQATRLYMELCANAGRWNEALSWLRTRARNGDPISVGMLRHALRKMYPDRTPSADGDTFPESTTLSLNPLESKIGQAVARPDLVLVEPDPDDDTSGSADVSLRLVRRMEAWKERELREAAADLERAGQLAEAVGQYQRNAEAGDVNALFRAVLLAEMLGRADTIVPWLQARADGGDRTAVRIAAQLLDKLGRRDEAITWYLRVVETGNLSALPRAAALLAAAGREDEAFRLTRYGLEPGGVVASALLANDA